MYIIGLERHGFGISHYISVVEMGRKLVRNKAFLDVNMRLMDLRNQYKARL
jgi:hypothetical protein